MSRKSPFAGELVQQRTRLRVIPIILTIIRKGNKMGTVLLWACALVFAQTPDNGIAGVKSALQRQDFDSALELLNSKLRVSPKSPQLWTLRGLAYQGKDDQKQALASFEEALKNAPDYLPALEGAAKIEYDAENPRATYFLNNVLRVKPGDRTANAMLGVLAFKRGDCAQAIAHFEQGGALLDSQPVAMQEYAACLVKANQTEKAIAVCKQMVRSRPDDPDARRSLAAVQITAHQAQDALQTLEPLLATAPDVRTMRLAAAAYENNKDTPNAVKTLREAIVKEPRDTGLYVDFANLAMDHQSFQTGIEMVNAGLALQPDSAPLYLTRGILYVQLAEYDKAEADFEKSEQLNPHQSASAAAYSLMAQEKNQKDPGQALATVRSKLSKRPNDPYLLYLESTILADKAPDPGSADFRQAIESAKKALARRPSLCAAYDVMAKLYQSSNQIQLSTRQSRLALSCDPQDQTALYHLIQTLRKSDEKSEIPDLLKRLAKARQDATREEAEHNRYKLVAEPTSPTGRN